MKKIRLFWWIFWLIYSFEVVGPELMEARQWTSKQEFRSEQKSCDRDGRCASSSSFTQSKQWDNRQNFGNYGYGGGYYYSPGSSGGSNNINIDIDLRPVVRGLGCLFTLGLVCDP